MIERTQEQTQQTLDELHRIEVGMQKVHAAHCTYRSQDGEVSVHWFASVDGEEWVEVSNDARIANLATIRRAVGLSADGMKRVRYPMTFTRGYLAHRLHATFLSGERHA